jgi:hypothetical protein
MILRSSCLKASKFSRLPSHVAAVSQRHAQNGGSVRCSRYLPRRLNEVECLGTSQPKIVETLGVPRNWTFLEGKMVNATYKPGAVNTNKFSVFAQSSRRLMSKTGKGDTSNMPVLHSAIPVPEPNQRAIAPSGLRCLVLVLSRQSRFG